MVFLQPEITNLLKIHCINVDRMLLKEIYSLCLKEPKELTL